MSKENAPPTTASTDQTWQQLEEFIDGIGDLVTRSTPFEDFLNRLLTDSVRALGLSGAGFWSLADGGQLQLLKGANFGGDLHAASQQGQWHQTLAALSITRPTDWFAPGWKGSTEADSEHQLDSNDGGSSASNSSEANSLYQPIEVEGRLVALLEFVVATDLSNQAAQSLSEIAATLAELSAGYLTRMELTHLRSNVSQYCDLIQAMDLMLASASLDEVAFNLANESRRLGDVGRVSVVLTQGRDAKTLSVSGVDEINRRSATVKLLERLVSTVKSDTVKSDTVKSDTVHVDYHGRLHAVPAESQSAMKDFVEETKATRVILFSTSRSETSESRSRDIGAELGAAEFRAVTVFEWFDSEETNFEAQSEPRSILPAISQLGGKVVLQAQEAEPTGAAAFFFRLAKMNQRLAPRKRRLVLSSVLAVATLFAIIMFIPATFSIQCSGTVQPVQYRHLFAPQTGTIAKVHVEHNQVVSERDLLLEMESFELARLQAELNGQLLETVAELESINAKLANPDRSSLQSGDEREVDASRLRLLEQRKVGLERQLLQATEQVDELKVKAPISGNIVTWDVLQSLETRPVTRGQRLLSVAQVEGVWQAELQIKDKDIGHVTEAWLASQKRSGSDAEMTVELLLRSETDVVVRGTLQSISETTQVDSFGTEYVVAKVKLDRKLLGNVRPGARVIAKIDCGKKSLAFVWLRDVIEVIQTRILF